MWGPFKESLLRNCHCKCSKGLFGLRIRGGGEGRGGILTEGRGGEIF